MEIEQQIWGATSEGEAVVLYTLRNAAGAEEIGRASCRERVCLYV